MKFYKCNPTAFLEGTSELTLKQCGLYSRVINLIYSRDGIVPDDDRLVARMLNVEIRTWRNVGGQLRALGKLWVGADGYLKTPRVDETISDAEIASKSVKLQRTSRELRTNLGRELSKKRSKINGNVFSIQSQRDKKEEERDSPLKGESLSSEISSRQRKALPFAELQEILRKGLERKD